MKKCIQLLSAGSLLIGSASFACTADEAKQKAQDFDAEIAELRKNDPVKAVSLSARLKGEQARQDQEATDHSARCALYDELLAEVRGETAVEPEASVSLEAPTVENTIEEPGTQ